MRQSNPAQLFMPSQIGFGSTRKDSIESDDMLSSYNRRGARYTTQLSFTGIISPSLLPQRNLAALNFVTNQQSFFN